MAKKTFKQKVKDYLNRDEKEIQDELVDEKVDQYIIDCNTAIGLIEIKEIPEYKGLVKTEGNKLSKAKKELEKSKLNLRENFASYIGYIKECERQVSLHEANIVQHKLNIEKAEEEGGRLKEVLATLES